MVFFRYHLAVILLWKLFTVEKILMLFVSEISKFPHAENSPFHLQILPGPSKFNMNVSPTEIMVIAIKDKNYLLLEKHIFNYGIQYSIDEELIGNFIDIPIWQRDINSTIINITILFKKDSNSKLIEIFHLPANSIESRLKMLRNLRTANLIYSRKIHLMIPSTLELFVKSIHQPNNELLLLNEIAIATCRAYGGIRKIKPIFENHKSFNVIESEYNIERDERKLWFNVSLFDHLKILTCKAENTFKSTTIFVLHNPSMIYINPEIGETIQPNQTIVCFAKDGYPPPLLNWNFISGPSNASMFYEINQTRLNIKMHSPVESIWKFYCSSNNKTQKSSNKTISFIIRKKAIEMKETKIDNNLNKLNSMEKFINDEIKSLRSIINKLAHDNKKFNQMKNNEMNNISKIVDKMNHNQYLVVNITNTKINNLNISIDKMKMENELFKQNNYKQIDVFMKNSSQLIKLLVEKNDRLNRSIQSIIENMANQIGKMKFQMTTIKSEENKNNKLITNSDSKFDWIIDKFTPIKLKINFKSFEGIKYDDKYNFNIDIWYWFSRNQLRIYFYIKSFPFTKQLNSTVQIINKSNKNHYKHITKEFKISKINNYRSPHFTFYYLDLLKSGVLKGNSIIIRCNLLWMN